MDQNTDTAIRIKVDPANPGQFFACCGLLELTDRFWGDVEGWFDESTFVIRKCAEQNDATKVSDLVTSIANIQLLQADPDDDCATPIEILTPSKMFLNWWKENRTGPNPLKVWAGSMHVYRIARAMQAVLKQPNLQNTMLLDYGTVVYDLEESDKKVEPFYFDARRGANAHPIDIGFAPNKIEGMTTTAYPAVEFLCLIGLQRFRPVQTGAPRVFDYFTWHNPLALHVAPAAACGLLPHICKDGYRFEITFRTDQKKHKAFMPATKI